METTFSVIERSKSVWGSWERMVPQMGREKLNEKLLPRNLYRLR